MQQIWAEDIAEAVLISGSVFASWPEWPKWNTMLGLSERPWFARCYLNAYVSNRSFGNASLAGLVIHRERLLANNAINPARMP